jgi:thiol-disulfide isomerase/thioredoxin
MAHMVNRLFRRFDASGDGRVTKAEWDAFFKKAAGGQEDLTSESLRDALLAGVGGSGFRPGDAPDPAVLVRGLFAGEIGSLQEGPKLGQSAPDFTLKTPDGTRTVRLSELTGPKPVVLVFGNFTCGPFRSMYPGADAVYQRHKGEANFLGVYVREAHPTDGWAMRSNKLAGVAVKQPATYAQRVGVAKTFCSKLTPSFPFLVDEITDPVGNAYSGMPARLYVIDPAGRVAYKSGRGPFGFKTGEMEQAIVMSLLEAKVAASRR